MLRASMLKCGANFATECWSSLSNILKNCSVSHGKVIKIRKNEKRSIEIFLNKPVVANRIDDMHEVKQQNSDRFKSDG